MGALPASTDPPSDHPTQCPSPCADAAACGAVRDGCHLGWWGAGSAQERPPPEGVRVEHVDASDAVRVASGVIGYLDRPVGLELLQELDEGIGLLPRKGEDGS